MNLDEPEAVEEFKVTHHVSDEDLEVMQKITLPAERVVQDYRSTYNDIRDRNPLSSPSAMLTNTSLKKQIPSSSSQYFELSACYS